MGWVGRPPFLGPPKAQQAAGSRQLGPIMLGRPVGGRWVGALPGLLTGRWASIPAIPAIPAIPRAYLSAVGLGGRVGARAQLTAWPLPPFLLPAF
jgi:hypothetical protein